MIFRIQAVGVGDSKIPMVSGDLTIGDEVFSVASGGWGNGPIPCGIYRVNRSIRLADTENNSLYKGEQFPWYSVITPLFKTPRTGFLIHPKGKWKGTLGCIEVWEKELRLFEVLHTIKEPEILTVI